MAWPSISRDVALADAIRAAIEAMPQWMELEPLDGSVHALTWPTDNIDGPRALVHPPQLVRDAVARDAGQATSSLVVEVHVPVDAREALAAFGVLADALLALRLPGVRILSTQLTAFERGKYVSTTAASVGGSCSVTTSTTDAVTPAWSTASAVAYKGEITIKLFQVPFTTL